MSLSLSATKRITPLTLLIELLSAMITPSLPAPLSVPLKATNCTLPSAPLVDCVPSLRMSA